MPIDEAMQRGKDYLAVTPFSLAWRFHGMRESAGAVHNPLIVAMLKLDAPWVSDDETPWCSAFVNFIAWQLGCARSRSLRARSWLTVGEPVEFAEAKRGFDVVVMTRGGGLQPGADVVDAPGHVGFFDSYNHQAGRVNVLGGNQRDAVTIESYPIARILGVRRI